MAVLTEVVNTLVSNKRWRKELSRLRMVNDWFIDLRKFVSLYQCYRINDTVSMEQSMSVITLNRKVYRYINSLSRAEDFFVP